MLNLQAFNHFYLIPLFGVICWYIWCFALIGLWVSGGKKTYPEYSESSTPVPLEKIGVILSPGFSLAFIIIHCIIFIASMCLEYHHRNIGKLIKFIKPVVQKKLALSSLIVAIIAQLFFIAHTIVCYVTTKKQHSNSDFYREFLITFAVLISISLALNFTNYYIMGQYYKKYINGETWNKFTISFIVKSIWLVVTISLGIVFCVLYTKKMQNVASIFEWIFHLWYGLLLVLWTYDLYPMTEFKGLKRSSSKIKRRFWSYKGEVDDAINSTDSSMSEANSFVELGSVDYSTLGSKEHAAFNIESASY